MVDDGEISGKDPQVVFLDVGLVTQLSSHDRKNFLALFRAVLSGDSALAAELITNGQTHLAPETISKHDPIS